MSGGSYDYLYAQAGDAEGLGRRFRELHMMADRLDGINPESHAACDTREVLAFLTAAETWSQRLADVWHAVEWRDSNDWGEPQMLAALVAYQVLRDVEEVADVE